MKKKGYCSVLALNSNPVFHRPCGSLEAPGGAAHANFRLPLRRRDFCVHAGGTRRHTSVCESFNHRSVDEDAQRTSPARVRRTGARHDTSHRRRHVVAKDVQSSCSKPHLGNHLGVGKQANANRQAAQRGGWRGCENFKVRGAGTSRREQGCHRSSSTCRGCGTRDVDLAEHLTTQRQQFLRGEREEHATRRIPRELARHRQAALPCTPILRARLVAFARPSPQQAPAVVRRHRAARVHGAKIHRHGRGSRQRVEAIAVVTQRSRDPHVLLFRFQVRLHGPLEHPYAIFHLEQVGALEVVRRGCERVNKKCLARLPLIACDVLARVHDGTEPVSFHLRANERALQVVGRIFDGIRRARVSELLGGPAGGWVGCERLVVRDPVGERAICRPGDELRLPRLVVVRSSLLRRRPRCGTREEHVRRVCRRVDARGS
mmetsp:Transcript_13513/g.35842  ORF Transcript_13513/g.35842 Transcript_13513/m.35842 type:complete len:432 (+) Transcript_13513:52-1347(+)